MADAGLRDGVQVNAINPGTIRTARFEKRLEAFAAERKIAVSAAEKHYVQEENISRVGEPADIAALVVFIARRGGAFFARIADRYGRGRDKDNLMQLEPSPGASLFLRIGFSESGPSLHMRKS